MAQSVDTGTNKLIAEIEGAVGRIVFDNSERHNAITADMFAALAAIPPPLKPAPAIADCWASEDFAEGRTAFQERRDPQFRGR